MLLHVKMALWKNSAFDGSGPLHKPFVNSIPGQVSASLKEQIALLLINPHGIPIAFAPSFSG